MLPTPRLSSPFPAPKRALLKFVHRVPRGVLVRASTRVRAYTRALRYLEEQIRDEHAARRMASGRPVSARTAFERVPCPSRGSIDFFVRLLTCLRGSTPHLIPIISGNGDCRQGQLALWLPLELKDTPASAGLRMQFEIN